MKKVWIIPVVVIGALFLSASIYYYIFFMGPVKNTVLVFNIVPNPGIKLTPQDEVPEFSDEDGGLTHEQIDAIKAFDFTDIYSSGW